jgi:hypothetical protein
MGRTHAHFVEVIDRAGWVGRLTCLIRAGRPACPPGRRGLGRVHADWIGP